MDEKIAASEEQPLQRRILVAGANPDQVDMMAGILKRHTGCEVLAAYDGLKGLETATQELPDLIILDVNVGFWMPSLNGLEVLRQLRENPRTSRIPVVIITADFNIALPGQHPDVIEAGLAKLKVDVEGYCMKPINRSEFLALVRRILEKCDTKGR